MTIDADLNTRLLAALRIGTGLPELAYSGRPEPLTGGFAAELLAFALADPPPGWPRQLVARIMPEAGVARKETIVQAAVAASGFPTPAVRLAGGPGSSLGRAFMVMDRAAGSPLFPGLHGAGTIAAGARQAGRLPHILAASMAALHAIDPQPVRDQLRDLGDVPVTLCGLLCALRDAAERFRRDDLARAARWLIDHPRPRHPRFSATATCTRSTSLPTAHESPSWTGRPACWLPGPTTWPSRPACSPNPHCRFLVRSGRSPAAPAGYSLRASPATTRTRPAPPSAAMTCAGTRRLCACAPLSRRPVGQTTEPSTRARDTRG
jgi:hypothetical protein